MHGTLLPWLTITPAAAHTLQGLRSNYTTDKEPEQDPSYTFTGKALTHHSKNHSVYL